MMYPIKVLSDIDTAVKVGKFLTGKFAFEQTWAPKERAIVKQAVLDSVRKKNHRYWYVEDNGKIIGAIGVRENKYGSDGYEMDSDYVAVHKSYRRLGLANNLLKEVENFVITKKERYIHILICDIDSYKPANRFYEANGYKKVGAIPNYYVEGEGRLDYFKKF